MSGDNVSEYDMNIKNCHDLNEQIKKLESKSLRSAEENVELKKLKDKFDKIGCVRITDPLPGERDVTWIP